jgi:hypothetical protein
MGQIDAFSGDMEVDECVSKNEIRNKPLLGGECFDIFIGIPLIYDVFIL